MFFVKCIVYYNLKKGMIKMANALVSVKKGKETLEQVQKQITEMIQNRDTDRLRKYLEYASSFREYSPRNSMMIRMQLPNATRVMGKKQWEKYGMKPAKEDDAIIITGVRWIFRTNKENGAEIDEWLSKNPLGNLTNAPEINKARMEELKKGISKPQDFELSLIAQANGMDVEKLANDYRLWMARKPAAAKYVPAFIPVKVYDISQCVIVDENKAKTLPMPEMTIRGDTDEIFDMALNAVEKAGLKIDESMPQVTGIYRNGTIFIDGNESEETKLVQLLQGWAQSKMANRKTDERLALPTMLASVFMVLSSIDMAETVSEDTLDMMFLHVKSHKDLIAVISKGGEISKEMLEDLTVERDMVVQKQKEQMIEELPEWPEF
jgi:hypothetical protein